MKGILLAFFLIISFEVFSCLQTRVADCVFSSNCEAHDYELVQRAQSDQKLTLTFAVKNKNMDKLYELLNQVSNPKSSEYGKYLSLEQLSELTTNHEAKTVVLSHLSKFVESNQVKLSEFTNFIQVETDVKTAEKLMNGEYHKFSSKREDHEVVRMLEYELPKEVSRVLDWVSPTVDFPQEFSASWENEQEVSQNGLRSKKKDLSERKAMNSDGQIVPEELKSYYNIPNIVVANEKATQLIISSVRFGSYNPDDIKKFQKKFGLVKHGVDSILFGTNNASACASDPTWCSKLNGQFQYLLAVAQNATTSYWSNPKAANSMEEWVTEMAALPHPPLVQAMTIGWAEEHQHPSQLDRTAEEIAKLGTRGVTIVSSMASRWKCTFYAGAISTFPYVLTVASTMGPEFGYPERPRQSNMYNSTVTTSGGFSNHFPRPDYQKKVVKAYLSNQKVTSDPRFPSENQFNASGRAFPDVSLLGSNFYAISNGTGMLATAISASAFAGILTLINNDRLNAGKPPLGFVNPAIYQVTEEDPSIFKDIKKGEGLCIGRSSPDVEPACCDKGWFCVEGWDPLTGLGSPDVGKLMMALNKL